MARRMHRLLITIFAFSFPFLLLTETLSGQEKPVTEKMPAQGLYRDKKEGMLYCNGKKLGPYTEAETARFRLHPYPKFLTFASGNGVSLLYEGTDSWRPILSLSRARGSIDESFEVLNPFLARDKTTTYYLGREPCGPLPDAPFLELSFFTLAGNPPAGDLVLLPDPRYMKSPERVYYLGRPVPGADPKTFVTYSQEFPSVAGSTYNETTQDFERIEAYEGIAADDRHVFLGDAIAPRLKPGAGFRPLSRFLAIADGAVYMPAGGELVKIDAADARSLRMVGRSFARDRNTVFYRSFALTGADPETFREIDDGYGCDLRRVFAYNFEVAGADPKTFRSLGRGYARDEKRVYVQGAPIPEADPAKFTLYPIAEKYKAVLRAEYRFPEENFLFARDGKRVFHGAVVVPNADPRMFQPEEYLIGLIKAEKERIDRLYEEGKIRF